MSDHQSRTKLYYYIGAGAILVGLIALLWYRYDAQQDIIHDLGSDTLTTRVGAAEILLRKGILADVLPAQPPARRIRAASALRAIAQDPKDADLRDKAITQLVNMLKDPDDDVQHDAWEALGKVGVPALPFLRHRDPDNKDEDYSVLKEGDARAKEGGKNALVMMASDAKVAIIEARARAIAAKAGGATAVEVADEYLLWRCKRDAAAEAMAAAEPGFERILRAYPAKAEALRMLAESPSFRSSDDVEDEAVRERLERILAKRRVPDRTVEIVADYARARADSVEAERKLPQVKSAYAEVMLLVGTEAALLDEYIETLRRIKVSRLPGEEASAAEGEQALARTLAVLGEAAADADERDAADAVLGDLVIGQEPARLGVPEALKPLLAMARSEEVDNRKAALVALGERRIPEGAAPALDALQNDDLKQVAIRALGDISLAKPQPPEVREAVAPIMAELDDPVLRSDAARALGQIRDARAVPALAERLGDLDQDLWDSAVSALGNIADAPGATGEVGVSALIAALKADDPRRREGAAAALRGVDAPATVGPLTAALRDPVSSVRAEAAAALGWKDNAGAIQPLIATMVRDQSWQVIDSTVKSLGRIGGPTIGALIAAFARRAENEALPLYAEQALLKVHATYPQGAGRVLERQLIAATKNQNLDIAKWAVITLGDLGRSKKAEAVLRALLSSPKEELAWVAKEALREMGVEIE